MRLFGGFLDDLRMVRRARDSQGRARTPRSALEHEDKVRRAGFDTGWARTPTGRAARKVLQTGLLKPIAWTQTSPHVEGYDHIEHLRGPVVFVANHSSHLDAPLIIGSVPKRMRDRLAVGAAADYFFDAKWRAIITTLVFNAFPIERRGSDRRRSLAPQLLGQGWNLLLFPEGTRSEDGWMGRPRLGPAHLCVQRQVPMVPVVLRGTYAAMPRGRGWPLPGRPRVVVRYGRPLWPAEGEGARELHQRMVQAMARLWAEDELGWYGSLRAAAKGELSLPSGPRQITADGSGEVVRAGSWRRTWEATRPMAKEPRRSGVWEE